MTTVRSPGYEVVDPATLLRRLADASWIEAPVTDGASPLTVVHLDGEPAPPAPEGLPVSTPRVLVAVGGASSPWSDLADVLLDDDPEGARTLAEIAATCAANPRAASLAAQLLRTAELGSIEGALWRESVTYSMLLAGAEFSAWLDARPPRRSLPDDAHDADAPVTVEDHGDHIDVVLNRPHVHNAYNASMRDALVDVLRALVAIGGRPRLRLSGRGPSFCSGGDLGEFGTTPDVVHGHAVRTNRAPGLLLHALGDSASARVHGACVGAGTELAAFCAHVEAGPDAQFRLPEVAMGLVPGAGGTVSVARRVGRQRAALLALTGRTIDAGTALEWGLIDAIEAID